MISRVGADKDIKWMFVWLRATKDLKTEIAEGRFRRGFIPPFGLL
jgi:hypothetical protein